MSCIALARDTLRFSRLANTVTSRATPDNQNHPKTLTQESTTMSRNHFIGAALLLALAGTANASSFVVTTDAVVRGVAASTDATSDLSSSLKDDKVVQAARDDAATFVGSEGAIRGAKLESAFIHIREQQPSLQASDAQLAQAILAL